MHVAFREFYNKYKSFDEGGHEILEFPVRQRSFFPSETRCSTLRFHWGFPRTFLDIEAEGNNTLRTALYDSCFISEQLQGIHLDSVKKKCHSQSQDTRVIQHIIITEHL